MMHPLMIRRQLFAGPEQREQLFADIARELGLPEEPDAAEKERLARERMKEMERAVAEEQRRRNERK